MQSARSRELQERAPSNVGVSEKVLACSAVVSCMCQASPRSPKLAVKTYHFSKNFSLFSPSPFPRPTLELTVSKLLVKEEHGGKSLILLTPQDKAGLEWSWRTWKRLVSKSNSELEFIRKTGYSNYRTQTVSLDFK